MKKQAYVIIALTSFLFVFFFSHSLLEILDFDWSIFLHDVEKTEKFVFLLLVFSMSITCLLALFWRGIEELSLRKMQANLKRLLAGQEVVQVADPDLDASFKSLSGKLNLLTEALQKAENHSLAQEEEIIEKERKRIARDLHDTVSQELFAAHMILSGISQQALKLDREKMQTQLQSVTAILETAQKDLRVLLLHLRPVELEQKSLIEGIQILLKELEDKSDLRVSLKQNMTKLPKKIEEHIFRILQELISNTLRHAQASCLDVYLYQTDVELQLKVVDNGIGFQLGSLDDLSYGLRNIKERVEDMATCLLALFWRGIEELSLRKMQANLKRLLAGQEVVQVADPDLDASFKSLSGKLNLLTEALQKAENHSLAQEEEIIEKERKRIARDLHDTVSQELFAAHMILSGISQQALKLDREKMQIQLQSVTAILETAQKDLRVLLLHLRPVELEQKSLIEGIQILLKELEDKSDLRVSLKQNMTKLPKKIEEHIFRILQELISNTLRHAQASCLDVYLYQTDVELQLKVVDNGIGFQLGSLDDLSYGLRNIKERVEDMAGTVQLLTAPKQGLAVDIRIPLLDKE
ncbi:histidine kinase [Streptococcus pneumoniae]|nr:histidine kinase [Streptococcus pneumoniae]